MHKETKKHDPACHRCPFCWISSTLRSHFGTGKNHGYSQTGIGLVKPKIYVSGQYVSCPVALPLKSHSKHPQEAMAESYRTSKALLCNTIFIRNEWIKAYVSCLEFLFCCRFSQKEGNNAKSKETHQWSVGQNHTITALTMPPSSNVCFATSTK